MTTVAFAIPEPRHLGVPVRYCPHDSAEAVSEDLSDAWSYPFELARPFRRMATYKGQRNFIGSWWSATTMTHVGFESWVERDHLVALDHDRQVTGIAAQPFEIEVETDLGTRRHVPDYFVRHKDGTGQVLDVRPDELIKPKHQAVFDATARACALIGWTYNRLGAPAAVRTANLRWLSGYRHPRNAGPPDAWSKVTVLRPTFSLLNGAIDHDPNTFNDLSHTQDWPLRNLRVKRLASPTDFQTVLPTGICPTHSYRTRRVLSSAGRIKILARN